jgi:hypothetical protein
MPKRSGNNSVKLLLIYLPYNTFLKAFYVLFNHIIYIEYPENIGQAYFRTTEGDNIIEIIFSNIFLNIIYDFFWLLPATIMNFYIFYKLITSLLQEKENVYEYISFLILKVYLFWCLIYLCSIGFGSFIKEDSLGSLLSGSFAPYGGLMITYILLGNFVFLILFVPLWEKYIKKLFT